MGVHHYLSVLACGMQYDELSGWVELWIKMDVLIGEMKGFGNTFNRFGGN